MILEGCIVDLYLSLIHICFYRTTKYTLGLITINRDILAVNDDGIAFGSIND